MDRIMQLLFESLGQIDSHPNLVGNFANFTHAVVPIISRFPYEFVVVVSAFFGCIWKLLFTAVRAVART